MNILLIDKRVQDYETIVAAIDPALAVGVVFDYYEDTFDAVKARIGALGLTNGTNQISVGLIQHNYRAPMFTMLASADVAPVAQVATQDPDLAAWTQFRDFITWCKTDHGAAHFDLMACALYSDPDWKYVIDTLTTQTGVTVRASTDDTGAASLGGDWFLESHTGVNLKTVYFTEAIEEYRGVLFLISGIIRSYSTKGFATGSIHVWGASWAGGNAPAITDGVVSIYSSGSAFAALKTDGSVVAWGDYSAGGGDPAITGSVIAVYSTNYAFAALKTDGSVVAWGDYYAGGNAPAITGGVVAVYSTTRAFAALKSDGSVVAWGDTDMGGSDVSYITGVVAVYSTEKAFAALKTDGSIVTWGNYYNGGASPGITGGVVAVYSTLGAFAALKSNGSVVTWGHSGHASDSSSVAGSLNSDVVAVYSNQYNFAALKSNGSIVTWGSSGATSIVSSDAVAVYYSGSAFAALKSDGSVVAWGSSGSGGTAPGNVGSGVVAVYSTLFGAFAALKSDGSVVAWGNSAYGGMAPGSVGSNVVAVYSTFQAFAALKRDGSVVAWGGSDGGTTAPNIVTNENSGVVAMYSNSGVFAALKTTATTIDLSFSYYSDMDRYNILRKKENRRRANLTSLNNVFTLSNSLSKSDIKLINPNIPLGSAFNIIIPDYESSYSIASAATIPAGGGNFIIACDEGERVTISGTTYVNYGSFVYTVNASGSYVKPTTTTINQVPYTLYGGDGINSSGIALLDARTVPTLSSTTFSVASNKTFGDASFNDFTRPTSDSSGAITYSSSNTAVATIDVSGTWITLVGAGDVNFIATQEGNATYAAATKTSNTLTVQRGTSDFSASTFSVASSKIFGDASFNIITAPTSNNSNGAITYSSSNTAVATIDISGTWITLVAAGDVSFNATQAQTAQYESATKTSNTLTVDRRTTSLSSFSVASSKIFGDASFNIITAPTSNNSSVAITYSSSNTAVATIDISGTWITLVAAGDVSFNATQAQTAQYESATKTSNTLTVLRGTTSLSSFSVAGSKTFGAAPFSITAPTSDSSGAITYSSNAAGVATINPSSGIITLVAAGTATFTASQAQSAQYNAPTPVTSNTLTVALGTTSLSAFSVAESKTFEDAPFSTTAPTSASNGAITFSSNATNVATINASSGIITLVAAGTVTFTASQAASAQYNAPTPVTSNTLTVAPAASDFSGSTFLVDSNKTFGDASFNITTAPTSIKSDGAITYSSSNPAVATIDTSGNFINLVGGGTVYFIATQLSTPQYASSVKNSNTLTVALGTTSLTSFSVAGSKTFGDAPFSITAPTSDSSGAITYSSNATGVATINPSSGIITLVAAGTVTFTASQAESAQYESPTPVTSNTLTVSRGTTSLSSLSVAESKTFGDAPFSITVPTSDSSGAITYSSNATGVATINASSGIITLVAAGTATFTASQAESPQYNAPTPVTSNTLTVSKGTTTLAFVSPPTTKILTDDAFTVVASSASSGAITYTSSNTARATVGLTTGLVTLLDTGSVTITAAQASSAQYNAPTNTTFTMTIGAAANLSGQTVTTSLAGKNLTGISLVGTNLTNISLANTNLRNVDLSGADISGASFINTDLSGATNLPVFSTTQKLQLMRNSNNAAISEVQISTPLSGAEINAAITTPIPDISGTTFVVKAPAYNVNNEKLVTVTAEDMANNESLYIPMNSGETVKVNGVAYTFNGTNILNSSGSVIQFINVLGNPFRLYAGSIVGLNVSDQLNNIKLNGDGLYDILVSLFAAKT